VTLESNGYFIDAWQRFLHRYTWDLYGHLTFRGTPSDRQAEDAFRKWIHKLNRRLYGQTYWKHHSGVRWVRGEEVQQREVVHYHVLVGHGPVTAPFGRTLTVEYARQAWFRLAGDGLVEIYHPAKHGIAYLAKKYHPGYGRIAISESMGAAPL
jgi:hypothetical protein